MNLFKKEQKHGRWITTYVPVKFMYNTVTHALKCSECVCVVSWNSKLEKCPLKGLDCNEPTSITQKHITGVQTWSDFHPVKTRQSEFLKMFPNTDLELDFIAICPRQLGEITLEGCRTKSPRHCDDCRREYWMEEIE